MKQQKFFSKNISLPRLHCFRAHWVRSLVITEGLLVRHLVRLPGVAKQPCRGPNRIVTNIGSGELNVGSMIAYDQNAPSIIPTSASSTKALLTWNVALVCIIEHALPRLDQGGAVTVDVMSFACLSTWMIAAPPTALWQDMRINNFLIPITMHTLISIIFCRFFEPLARLAL